jgi:hypothetical protein
MYSGFVGGVVLSGRNKILCSYTREYVPTYTPHRRDRS